MTLAGCWRGWPLIMSVLSGKSSIALLIKMFPCVVERVFLFFKFDLYVLSFL